MIVEALGRYTHPRNVHARRLRGSLVSVERAWTQQRYKSSNLGAAARTGAKAVHRCNTVEVRGAW